MTDSVASLEQCIPRLDAAAPEVSAWTVGMQVQHALIATREISRGLAGSAPGARKPTRSVIAGLILLTGRIPRGRGRAPRASLPSADITEEGLRTLLAEAREALAATSALPRDAWWEHPRFGVMHRDTAVRFLHIHNRHHLAIARDILRRARPAG